MKRESLNSNKKILVLLLCFILFGTNEIFSQSLNIHTIRVHGDAHLVQTPCGKTMLIDAGSPWQVGIIKEFIDSLGITKIDIAYLTHFHGDHFGGYAGEDGILSTYHVSEFYGVDEEHAQEYFQHLMLPYSKNTNIEYQVMKRGDFIDLDPDIEIKILYPPDLFPNVGKNNSSAACMITDLRNGRKFLYMGDGMEKQARELVDYYHDDLKCDVLKYGHHLQYEHDDHFSLGTFMEAAQPKYGIITKHNMPEPGPAHASLTRASLMKLYDYTWGNDLGLKSVMLAKHGHITVKCLKDGEISISSSENNLFLPPEIFASEESGIKNGPLTLTLTLSEPTWDHYEEEIRGCYSTDGGITWNDFFYPEKQLEISKTTTVKFKARDIYGNSSILKTVKIVIAPTPVAGAD